MRKQLIYLVTGSVLGAVLISGALSAASTTKICFEAELGKDVQTPPKVVNKASNNWSGAGYMEVPENSPKSKGSASYTITVSDPGYYYVWARTYWKDGCGNSVGIQIDSYSPATLGQDGTYNHWHWVEAKGAKFNLSAGKHTIKLLGREPGIMVDQIFLTKDSEYVPVAIRPVTQKPS